MTNTLLIQTCLAFVAGILLNLMPCVFAALPLKIRSLLTQPAQSHKQAAVGFFLGSITIFMALAAGTVFLGLTWGSLFQSKWFVLILVFILAFSGLSMLFPWSLPMLHKLSQIPMHSMAGPFVTGAMAGILATPCIGPFVGSVLVYAMTMPAIGVFWLFTAIGAGLAAPSCLLLLNPRWLDKLPRTGAWSRAIEVFLALILISAAAFFTRSLFATPVSTYEVDAFELAMHHKQPVLLKFTATWCANCELLDKALNSDRTFLDLLHNSNVKVMKIDMTIFDEKQLALLKRYGGQGLPFMVLLNHNGNPLQTFEGLTEGLSLKSAFF